MRVLVTVPKAATFPLAQMWDDDHMDGAWWWVMGIGWLVFLFVLVVIGYLLVRHLVRPDGSESAHPASPEAILAERFARGEIDDDEYRRRRSTLGRSD